MKKLLIILVFISLSAYYFVPNNTKTQFFDTVWVDGTMFLIEEKKVGFDKGETVQLKFDEVTNKTSFTWNVSKGKMVENISLSTISYKKCFSDNDPKFVWNTVFHRVLLWKNKTAVINLNTDAKLNMYVYKTDPLSKVTPPELEQVFDCKVNTTFLANRTVEIKWNSITSDIVIWLVWDKWDTTWEYSIEIEQK